MPAKSRMLEDLKHASVSGNSMFANPHVLSSQTSRPGTHKSTPDSTDLHIVHGQQHRRRARPVGAKILDQCSILIEEQLYSQAYSLLSSSLTAGSDTCAPACIPPPQYLAVAATLVVHPSMTTRTDSIDKHAAADSALRYLRSVALSVDPGESGLTDALRLDRGTTSWRRERIGKRAITRVQDDTDGMGGQDTNRLRCQYADKQSLAANADDFWAVVGWAFNCSVRHSPRWERWMAWLDVVLDVLHSDLESVARGRDQLPRGTDLSNTLIAQYLAGISPGRDNKRHILRAITADGGPKSTALFGEIWKNETSAPLKKEVDSLAKKRKLDLDNDEFGGYLDNESDEEYLQSRRRSRSVTRLSKRGRCSGQASKVASGGEDDVDSDNSKSPILADNADTFGGPDSIRLRQRLLSLLTRFSRLAPSTFVDIEDLFSLFTEFIRPLPLAVFQQFVLPNKPYLNADFHASLMEMLFRPLIGASSYRGAITQQEFEKSFASTTASNASAVDNAKVSVLTESLLRALWKTGSIADDHTELQRLVQEGARKRVEKVAGNGRRKGSKMVDRDVEAREIMQNSSDRMSVLLSMMAR